MLDARQEMVNKIIPALYPGAKSTSQPSSILSHGLSVCTQLNIAGLTRACAFSTVEVLVND